MAGLALLENLGARLRITGEGWRRKDNKGKSDCGLHDHDVTSCWQFGISVTGAGLEGASMPRRFCRRPAGNIGDRPYCCSFWQVGILIWIKP
jgi:hypothetical protein